MCRLATCPTCKKPTWAGCGAHVEQVMANIPPAERCKCREEKKSQGGGKGSGGKGR